MSNTGTFFEKTKSVCDKVGSVIGSICSWIYKLRKLIMAAPVVYLVTRNYAVFGPLLVTGFCLLLMFCSRKTLFPWIISIFSLVLPYLIYLTNLYPG